MKTKTLPFANPRHFLDLARRVAKEEGCVCLFSGGELDSARYSFLFLNPKETLVVRPSEGDPWAVLKAKVEEHPAWWCGYLGYELGASVEVDKPLELFKSPYPDAVFFRPAVVLCLDHLRGELKLHYERESDLPDLSLELESAGSFHSTSQPVFQDEEVYTQAISRIQEWIRDGEIYQLNLSQQVFMDFEGDPFSLYQHLCSLNPAPFSAFLNMGDWQIVSTSPERFLSKQGTRLETRPIKGTLPRGRTADEDQAFRSRLINCEKNRAELLMITDLMRNDLGRVSQVGSVETRELMRCEAYENVFHLLSVIQSEALPSWSSVDLVRSAFPGGSITGCPKLRAMELIAEVEKRARGIYTGSIGYFDPHGDFDFNIAIRTLVLRDGTLELSLGGAITIDSDPHEEYQETLHKGGSIFKALRGKEYGG